ncbi:MAG TPA: hypothetical protein VJ873_04280 [bacterium]|nr:hypothetical protein [bacterium]
MNILLWVLQVLLAIWNLIGSSFVAVNYGKVANAWALSSLPQPAWMVLAVLQLLLALGLVWPKLTHFAAIGLALISLLGCALYTQYAGFPGCLWGVIPAVLLAFVAYGRFVLKPF